MTRARPTTTTRDELRALAELLRPGSPPRSELLESYHVSELIRELHGVQHDAMYRTPAIGDALVTLRLIRTNARGWYDATPAGREVIASALATGSLACDRNCRTRD